MSSILIAPTTLQRSIQQLAEHTECANATQCVCVCAHDRDYKLDPDLCDWVMAQTHKHWTNEHCNHLNGPGAEQLMLWRDRTPFKWQRLLFDRSDQMQVHDLDMQDAHGVTTRFLCTLRAWSGTLEIEVPTWISFKSGRLLLESDNSTVCVKCCSTVHCLSRFNCNQLLHDVDSHYSPYHHRSPQQI